MSMNKIWETSYPDTLKNYQFEPELLTETAAKIIKNSVQHYLLQPAFTVVLPNGFSHTLSYQQVDHLSDAFACYLKHELHLKQGDVVGIQLPNGLHYPIAVFGIWKAGLIVTNINPLYTAKELGDQLKDCKAKLLIASDLFVQNAMDVVDELNINLMVANMKDFFQFPVGLMIDIQRTKETIVPDILYQTFNHALTEGQKTLEQFLPVEHPVALYQYTGGTTGKSKGAVIYHSNLLAVIKMAQDMLQAYSERFAIQPGDTILTALPMYHIFAFNFNFLLFFSQGGHNILIPNPRPLENLEKAFQKFDVNWITGVDTLFAGLLQQEWFIQHPPRLKLAISGGTSLRQSTAQAWKKQISTIVEGYGMTESSCFVSVNPPLDHPLIGSVGLPLPASELKIVDEHGKTLGVGQAGELWVKGPHIIEQYLNRPEENETSFDNGWFKTGDIATMDAQGFLTIVDRKKDLIIVSGFNVYPNEVEDVISGHPEVIEVAVIGCPDEASGESVRAFVVTKNKNLTQQELIAFCRKSLTNYKVPKQIEFREQLPKSAVGKILRAQLRHEMGKA
ncbi:AMP-binding protein [Acinetobacter sichuanensis]|nr:AMP-binding protein [Acinetobacter sichuanensis]